MKAKSTIIDKVKDYYLKGLNYNEIGTLLNLSTRTVQRYVKESECKAVYEPKTLEQQAMTMHSQGWSYAEIAKKLKKSKTTIYLWHKKARRCSNG
jgi:transposase